jgi:hypothetical protein
MAMKLVPEAHEDPLLAAIRSAPLVPCTPEEAVAFEEGLADIHAGRTVSAAQVHARQQARERE